MNTPHRDYAVNKPPVSEFKSRGGLKRIAGAVIYSMDGFRSAWKSEPSFRQEAVIAVPAAIIALLLPVTALEKLLLIAVLLLVLVVELLNSAIEAVVDRISLERHPLSKHAKDVGSAAVCLTLLLAGATWAVVLFPLFAEWLHW
ncbi:MAG: prokaryotic diacylglycerol kinase family protein [Herminiimonas sp.]|nr:prokaryotic diacylglycerol kinase family protein [Herminiimonas sp.]